MSEPMPKAVASNPTSANNRYRPMTRDIDHLETELEHLLEKLKAFNEMNTSLHRKTDDNSEISFGIWSILFDITCKLEAKIDAAFSVIGEMEKEAGK